MHEKRLSVVQVREPWDSFCEPLAVFTEARMSGYVQSLS